MLVIQRTCVGRGLIGVGLHAARQGGWVAHGAAARSPLHHLLSVAEEDNSPGVGVVTSGNSLTMGGEQPPVCRVPARRCVVFFSSCGPLPPDMSHTPAAASGLTQHILLLQTPHPELIRT